MKHKRPVSQRINLILIVLLTAACATAQPEIALAPPTNTPAPPTATTAPPTATTVPTATTAPTETPAPTDTPEPTEIPALNPSRLGYVSMTYDSESDKIILFGGLDVSMKSSPPQLIPNGETWAFDVASNTWNEMKPASGPSARFAIDLVYDSESDRVILFGGGHGLSDTWAYDHNTNTWTEMSKGPREKSGYRMAYDSESDRCILFGGRGFDSQLLYNDTWAYDFNSDTWTKMQPSISPSARYFSAMAYNTQVDRVILFGGSEWDEKMIDRGLSDTWAYDFNTDTWQELDPGDGDYPTERYNHTLVYNAGADRTILAGGTCWVPETWSYDYNTNTWTKLEPAENPGIRTGHAMVYSSASDRVILFGGQFGMGQYNYKNDTWVFDFNTNTWTNVTRSP
jgi:N-acetylneuraminic acid mutarotase